MKKLQQDSDYDILQRILILGQEHSGKKSLTKIFCEQCLCPLTDTQRLQYKNSDNNIQQLKFRKYKIRFNLYIHEKPLYSSTTQKFLQKYDAIILMFNKKNQNSFDHLQDLFDKVQSYSSKNLPVYIISVNNYTQEELDKNDEEIERYLDDIDYFVNENQILNFKKQKLSSTKIMLYKRLSLQNQEAVNQLFYQMAEDLYKFGYQNFSQKMKELQENQGDRKAGQKRKAEKVPEFVKQKSKWKAINGNVQKILFGVLGVMVLNWLLMLVFPQLFGGEDSGDDK